jgi:hypothetical protein
MDIVNFELAQKLKEKGFRKPCILYYNSDKVRTWFNEPDIAKNFVPTTLGDDDVLAPTISQVLKWLREEKKISIEPGIHWTLKWMCGIYGLNDDISDFTQRNNDGFILYDSYEQALLAGIEYVLDNVIKK